MRRRSITRSSQISPSNKLTPPLHGALLKNEQDVALFERLAFLQRRGGNDGGGRRGPAG